MDGVEDAEPPNGHALRVCIPFYNDGALNGMPTYYTQNPLKRL